MAERRGSTIAHAYALASLYIGVHGERDVNILTYPAVYYASKENDVWLHLAMFVISCIIVSCSLYAPLRLYYNLVSLIFGTTIPTSFNILIKCFFTLFSLVFYGSLVLSISAALCFTIHLFYILLVTTSLLDKSYSELRTRYNILLLIVRKHYCTRGNCD